MDKINALTFQHFLNSPTIISKVAFTIFVMFIFYVVMKFSMYYIPKIMNSDAHSPYLINGTIDGSHPIHISQNPSYSSYIPILRSNNEDNGVEFTWSVFLFIDDTSIDNNKDHTTYHIFHKGDDHSKSTLDETYPIACPGLYVNRSTNSIIINMNSFSNQTNTMVIDNIPMYKWFNVIIRVKNKTVDVYINGYIKKSMELNALPKQNNGDVYICQNAFKGKLSNLRYFDEALNIVQIRNLLKGGHNTKQVNVINTITNTSTMTNYLGYNWYL